MMSLRRPGFGASRVLLVAAPGEVVCARVALARREEVRGPPAAAGSGPGRAIYPMGGYRVAVDG